MHTPRMNTKNSMMQLRLAYLFCLTKSWENSDEGRMFRDHLTSGKDLFPFFQSKVPGFSVNWTHLEFSVTRSEQSNNHVLWNPELVQGWVGPMDHMELTLPAKPNIEPNQLAHALAQYYLLFPTPFGPTQEIEEDDSDVMMEALPTDLGESPESILDFGGVILRAVSVGWSHPEFFEELIKASNETGNATPILTKYLGWQNPFNFQLRFKISSDFTYTPTDSPNKLGWKNIPTTKIGVWYPEPPTEAEIQPIALTAYNEDGPGYPMSCS
ncbi:BMA_0021/BMA_0022 family TOMM bacteriocin [Sessilibacter corallicola]|uniref:BMA_0021/BMA_0022 family TOMM bacteriocin n=1 Tax=Sessilibacter corallicola TaxID=2904075 RepID=UPI001E3BA50E|nr:BMA_0021/BMA_0022 family TOMM bacteriocin [Sessilibacter corallicola]MCE2029020.1 BMA_0021/BMA_0022 family TOMM bacteriocin [Sessilibacter corallicola]